MVASVKPRVQTLVLQKKKKKVHKTGKKMTMNPYATEFQELSHSWKIGKVVNCQ
jgi:hypothetical protein